MAKQKKYTKLFEEPIARKTQLTLTLTSKYVSLSNSSVKALGSPEYISFASTEANEIAVFPEKTNEQGSFSILNKNTRKAKPIVRPQVSKHLADILGLDLERGTWRITGTYDDTDKCLLFKGGMAKLL